MGFDKGLHAVSLFQGRTRTTDLREVMNGILYIATTGCQWVILARLRVSVTVWRIKNQLQDPK
ncbi:transposase [Kiloniella laminariae]|uniref:transposase n=1 Tax=Kiloniella laminariae TaxID=454162 RepID=UPI000A0011AD